MLKIFHVLDSITFIWKFKKFFKIFFDKFFMYFFIFGIYFFILKQKSQKIAAKFGPYSYILEVYSI